MPKRLKIKREKKEGICTYCGRIKQLSEDHVIPQCLFVGKCPSDTPKVYACEECNGIVKSRNDAYLRDLLFADMNNFAKPAVQQLWGKFERSIQRNQSPEIVEAFHKRQLVGLTTPSGIFKEWAYELRIPSQRVIEVFSMMVRGLYQCAYGRKLLQDTTFWVGKIQGNVKPFEDTVQVLLQLGAPIINVGDGEVFRCMCACFATNPEESLWFLCFYGSVTYGVVTSRALPERAQPA